MARSIVFCSAYRCGWLLAATVALGACDGPSITESLEAKNQEAVDPNYKPNPKPRPKGLAGPTDAEFTAWNRSDPEGEKHLYKWDKAHLGDMMRYWEHLECFREKAKLEGEKAMGVEPGSPAEEQWFQFKRAFVTHIDGWQKRLFAEQPRILEKSKFIGNFLEAHELVMYGYLKAFNNGDKTELRAQEARWLIVQKKVQKYVGKLGGKWPERDLTKPKVAEAHAKVCADAMAPPDRSGKAKKRRKKKTSI